MREHHALRLARRARGVDDRRERVVAHRGAPRLEDGGRPPGRSASRSRPRASSAPNAITDRPRPSSPACGVGRAGRRRPGSMMTTSSSAGSRCRTSWTFAAWTRSETTARRRAGVGQDVADLRRRAASDRSARSPRRSSAPPGRRSATRAGSRTTMARRSPAARPIASRPAAPCRDRLDEVGRRPVVEAVRALQRRTSAARGAARRDAGRQVGEGGHQRRLASGPRPARRPAADAR